MQSKRRDFAEQQNCTLAYVQPLLCSTDFKRMIVMTTTDPYCPTCTSLHAPRLPTQRLTSQLCMHDELCRSTESTLRNDVMLRRHTHTEAPFTSRRSSQQCSTNQSTIINVSCTYHCVNTVKAVCWTWPHMSKAPRNIRWRRTKSEKKKMNMAGGEIN